MVIKVGNSSDCKFHELFKNGLEKFYILVCHGDNCTCLKGIFGEICKKSSKTVNLNVRLWDNIWACGARIV